MQPDRLSDARLVDFLNQLPDDVAVCTADGEILFVNDAWRRFSFENGYVGPDFVGQNYLQVCSNADGVEKPHAQAVRAGIHDVASNRAPNFTYVYPCHAPDERRWFKLLATRTGGDVIVQHQPVVMQHSTVTVEMKGVDETLLAERDARVAHDVKSALHGILGSIELAQLRLERGDDRAAVADRLRVAEQSGWRVDRMLDAMLVRARLLAGKGEFKHQAVDLREAVSGCVEALRATSNGVEIGIRSNMAQDLRLLAPHDLVDRILVNLISNAIKYNRPDGWIEIVLEQNRSGGMVVAVSDGGIGIADDALPGIFESYCHDVRVVATTQGTSLGLATMKEFVDALDGDIDVASEVGVGSTFTVAFPSWRSITADSATEPVLQRHG